MQKTINKCSIFPPEIEAILVKNNIVNGVGGEGANLDWVYEKIKKKGEKWIDIKKLDSLYNNIGRLSVMHDLQFLACSSRIEFYFANYIFVRDLSKILHWLPWYKRVTILLIILFLLNKYGKKYSRHTKIKERKNL